MPKFLLRFVSLLLLACLIFDGGAVAAFAAETPALTIQKTAFRERFGREALIGRYATATWLGKTENRKSFRRMYRSIKSTLDWAHPPHTAGPLEVHLVWVNGKPELAPPAPPEDPTEWRTVLRRAVADLQKEPLALDLGDVERAFGEADRRILPRLGVDRRKTWAWRRLQLRLLAELLDALAQNRPGFLERIGQSSDPKELTVRLKFLSSQGPLTAALTFRKQGPPLLGIQLQLEGHLFEDVHLGSDPVQVRNSNQIDTDHARPHWDFRDMNGPKSSWASHIEAYPSIEGIDSDVERQVDVLRRQLEKIEAAVLALPETAPPQIQGSDRQPEIPTLSLRDRERRKKQLQEFKKKLAEALGYQASFFKPVAERDLTHLILVTAAAARIRDSDPHTYQTEIREAVEKDLGKARLTPEQRTTLIGRLPGIVSDYLKEQQQNALSKGVRIGKTWILYSGRLTTVREMVRYWLPQWSWLMEHRRELNNPKVILPYYGPTMGPVAYLAANKNISLEALLNEEKHAKSLREWFDHQIQWNQNYEPQFGRLQRRHFEFMRERHVEHTPLEQNLVEFYLLANEQDIPCRVVEPVFELWRDFMRAGVEELKAHEAYWGGDVETFLKIRKALAARSERITRQFTELLLLEVEDERQQGVAAVMPLEGDFWNLVNLIDQTAAEVTVASTAERAASPYVHQLVNTPQGPAESNEDFELRLLRSSIALFYKHAFDHGSDADQALRARRLTEWWGREDLLRLHQALTPGSPNGDWEPAARLSLAMFLRLAAGQRGVVKAQAYFDRIARRLNRDALSRFNYFLSTFKVPETSEAVPGLILQWLTEDEAAEGETWITPHELAVLRGERWGLLSARVVDRIYRLLSPSAPRPMEEKKLPAANALEALVAAGVTGFITAGGIFGFTAALPIIGLGAAFAGTVALTVLGAGIGVAFGSTAVRILRAFRTYDPNMTLRQRLTTAIATPEAEHPAFALLGNPHVQSAIRFQEQRHRLGDNEKRAHSRQALYMLQFYFRVMADRTVTILTDKQALGTPASRRFATAA